MLYALFGLAIFGLVTSSVFAGMVVVGAHHYWSQLEVLGGNTLEPAVSLLKPVHGAEPGLEANLISFYEQDYLAAKFEVLFCARDVDDAGLAIARRVAERYPQVATRFFWTNGQPPYINAKVASLEKMTAAAANEILVISDSDVRVESGYLRAVTFPFSDPACGAMTCLYRGVAAEGGIWARLEAVGMSVEMTAGVLVANLLEGMQFVLGPTMAVRRECVNKMGGMGVMGDYCSDDYLLGNYVFQQGRKVTLSQYTIDHMVINASFVDSLKHQVRWMKSTRFSRPKGHFGTALTFSMPFGVLGLAAGFCYGRPWVGAALMGWAVMTRWVIAWAAGSWVVQDPSWFGLYVLYPVRDLMGFGFWTASYLSSTILWRGRVYQLIAGGRMKSVE